MADADADAVDSVSECASPLRTWYTDSERPDFTARLAGHTTLPTDHSKPQPELPMPSWTRSVQTSTVVHAHSDYDLDSLVADSVPPLTRENSVSSSSSSTCSALGTDTVSVINGGFVMESEDGALIRPARLQPDADLLCPFQILDCHKTFCDVVDFKMHVFAHFRGHPLPSFAPCFICGEAFFQTSDDDNAFAWNNMLTHMAYDHYRVGLDTCVIKPEVALMRYMWNRGIISDAEFKRVQLEASTTRLPHANPHPDRVGRVPEVPMAPSAPVPSEIADWNRSNTFDRPVGSHAEPYVTTAGRRQDRRQRDRTSLRARVVRGSNL